MPDLTIDGSASSPASAPQSDGSVLPRPSRTRRPKRLTFAEAVDHVLRNDDVSATESRSIERAKVAVTAANRKLAAYNEAGWKCYQSSSHMIAGGPVTMPEVTVSAETGSTKLITITGTPAPTLPTWLKYGHFHVGRQHYPITDEMSSESTKFRIDAPGLATGTIAKDGSSVEQIFIPFSNDFRRRGQIVEGENRYFIQNADFDQVSSARDFFNYSRTQSGVLKYGAITVDDRFQGTYFLAVWPSFGKETELSLSYEREAGQLDNHRVSDDAINVSTTGTSTTVTATASIFTSNHVGAMLVVAADDADTIRSSGSASSLAVDSRIITSVNSGTSIYVDDGIDLSTARAFYITDVVDVQSGPMCECFLRLCEWEFSRAMSSKSGIVANRRGDFLESLRLAMSDDNRYHGASSSAGELHGGSLIGDVNARPA